MKNIQTGLVQRRMKLRNAFQSIVEGADPRYFMDGPQILSTAEEHRFPWFLESGGDGDPLASRWTTADGRNIIRVHRQTVNPIRPIEWKVPLRYRIARWFR